MDTILTIIMFKNVYLEAKFICIGILSSISGSLGFTKQYEIFKEKDMSHIFSTTLIYQELILSQKFPLF